MEVPDAAAWERLGELLVQRRAQISPLYGRRTRFAEDRHLGQRVVYEIEKARRQNFGDGTIAALEAAYELVPGSLRRTLAGGPLEPAIPSAVTGERGAAPPVPVSAGNGQIFALDGDVRIPADMAVMSQDMAIRSTMPEILARARRILARNPRATGRDIFPGETEAPKIWDRLRRDDAFTLDECALYATAGHLEEERRKWRARRGG